MFWFVSLITFKPEIFGKRLMIQFLIYGAIMGLILANTLWIEVDVWNKSLLRWELYDIALSLSVIYYFRTQKDYVGLSRLVKWSMVFMFITGIMTIYTSLINPMYVRDIIGVHLDQRGAEDVLSYKRFGGGNYSYASAVLCIFPLIFFFLRNPLQSYWKRGYLILFGLTILLAIIRMQIFANILVGGIIILLSVFGRRNVIRARIYLGIIILILIILPLQIYADFLRYIASLFDIGSENYFKFNDMAAFIASGGGFEGTAAGGRAARWPILWKSFQANPLFGHFLSSLKNEDIAPGGHLYWMNKFAVYGLVGTVPFIYILYKNFKYSLSFFEEEFNFYFILSALAIVALGLMKVIAGAEMWFTYFVLVPGMYYLQLLKKQSN